MRAPVRFGFGLMWFLASVSGEAQEASREPPSVSWTTVSYLTGTTVYIDAGTLAGLAPGAPAEVVRGGTVIAELRVEHVSSRRASCSVVRSSGDVVVGDSVRFRARAPTGDSVVAAAAPGRVRRGTGGALRGRVGVRYFSTDVSGAGGRTITQPAVDARIDGQRLGGTPFGLTLDVRANRTVVRSATSAPTGGTGSTRVYQAALHSDGATFPGRLTIGRQFSTALAPVGLFDGVSAEWTGRRAATGVLAGSQPDPGSFGLSGAIREVGVWGRLHNATGSGTPWSVTSGVVGSYARDTVNREFLYVQGSFVHPVVSLFAAQEVDLNRGWKAEAESSATTLTSTLATARVSLGRALSLSGGYDGRRSVRLYRDFLRPDIEFDDSFRRGVWAGAQLALGAASASFDRRASRGGLAGNASSWTATARVSRLTALGLGARVRLTRHAGQLLEGELRSAAIEVQPRDRFRFEVNAGRRSDLRPLQGTEPTSLDWVGADFDAGLGRQWYFTLSTYHERSPDGRLLQHFASLTWRF